MRGNLTERNGVWSARVDMGKDATGKRKQAWIRIGRMSPKQAQVKLTAILAKKDIGEYILPGKDTVSVYLARWLRDYAKPSLTPKAYERYSSICRVHLNPAIGSRLLSQLQPAHIQAMYGQLTAAGLAPRTVKYCHVVLHKALVTAIKWQLLTRNPADGVDIPRAPRTEMQTWDQNELATFLEAAKATEYFAAFYTALATGARRSELLALRWCDLDLIGGQVSISRGLHHLAGGQYVFSQPKSAKSVRTIALTPSNALVLKAHWETQVAHGLLTGLSVSKDSLVFSTIEGKPLRPNTVSRAWANLAVKAGVKVIRLHDARHTHASLLLKQGVHPKIVQERLGHASIQITLDTYSHVAPGLQQAAAVRFDELMPSQYNGQGNNETAKHNR